MVDYGLPPLSKASREIDRSVRSAIKQVQETGQLAPGDRVEYAFLIVREKLDRMENDAQYEHLMISFTDAAMQTAVVNEIKRSLGVETEVRSHYPDDLSEIAKHGLSFVA
jgi:ribosomal protein L19